MTNILETLVQVICEMLTHLVRFSAFLFTILVSFALAFYVFFISCYEDDERVQASYGTLHSSMLTMFRAILGDFDFDVIRDAEDSCGRPAWANEISNLLLVIYLVIMTVLLLNLLIAILSTVHSKMDENATKAFYLVRSRAIQQNWRAVVDRRFPPPLNLVSPLLGCIADFPSFVQR